jgi:hypothetical protein
MPWYAYVDGFILRMYYCFRIRWNTYIRLHPVGASSGKEVNSIYDSESYAAMDAYSSVEFVEVISILSFQAWDSGTVGQEDRSLYWSRRKNIKN